MQRVALPQAVDLAPVGVADAHEGVGVAVGRVLDDDKLVAADAGTAVGDRRRLSSRNLRAGSGFPATRVNHHEIVAEPVHFSKRQFGHSARNMAGMEAKSSRLEYAGLGGGVSIACPSTRARDSGNIDPGTGTTTERREPQCNLVLDSPCRARRIRNF